jgi:hypothetical protein
MKKTRCWRQAAAALVLCALAPLGHAQVYKWTDTGGKVHYTDNRDEADRANARALEVPAAAPVSAAPKSLPSWQQQEAAFQRRQRLAAQRPVRIPSVRVAKVREWHTAGPETDGSRCNLARNIKDGLVRHSNGAKIDTNDRQVAAQDIASFCH